MSTIIYELHLQSRIEKGNGNVPSSYAWVQNYSLISRDNVIKCEKGKCRYFWLRVLLIATKYVLITSLHYTADASDTKRCSAIVHNNINNTIITSTIPSRFNLLTDIYLSNDSPTCWRLTIAYLNTFHIFDLRT